VGQASGLRRLFKPLGTGVNNSGGGLKEGLAKSAAPKTNLRKVFATGWMSH